MHAPRLTAITAVVLLAGQARSAEVKVLTAGTFKTVVQAVAPAFEQRTRHTPAIANDVAGAPKQFVLRGDVFDAIIVPPRLMIASRRRASSRLPQGGPLHERKLAWWSARTRRGRTSVPLTRCAGHFWRRSQLRHVLP